jgi:dihydroorotate dehydrogenase
MPIGIRLLSKHRGEIGGLSGKPVKDQSTECIRRLFRLTDGKIPIIGVGGVGSGHDAYEKLKAGASLVQVYSMMVYQGPGVISRIRHDLATLMLENGQRSIVDVIGADHEDIFWRKREERIAQKRRRDTRISIETLPVKKTEFA